MRKIFIFTLIICLFTFCKSNKSNFKVEKHIRAYEYLNNIKPYKDSGIYVVDTLFYIPKVYAHAYKTKNKSNDEKINILHSLWKLDEQLYYKEKYFKFPKSLKKNKSAMFNVYFDKQINDTLSVQIYYNHNNVYNPHYRISEFSTNEIFVFVFNSNGKIVNVINETVINN